MPAPPGWAARWGRSPAPCHHHREAVGQHGNQRAVQARPEGHSTPPGGLPRVAHAARAASSSRARAEWPCRRAAAGWPPPRAGTAPPWPPARRSGPGPTGPAWWARAVAPRSPWPRATAGATASRWGDQKRQANGKGRVRHRQHGRQHPHAALPQRPREAARQQPGRERHRQGGGCDTGPEGHGQGARPLQVRPQPAQAPGSSAAPTADSVTHSSGTAISSASSAR